LNCHKYKAYYPEQRSLPKQSLALLLGNVYFLNAIALAELSIESID
jgi:hypothetical protein